MALDDSLARKYQLQLCNYVGNIKLLTDICSAPFFSMLLIMIVPISVEPPVPLSHDIY